MIEAQFCRENDIVNVISNQLDYVMYSTTWKEDKTMVTTQHRRILSAWLGELASVSVDSGRPDLYIQVELALNTMFFRAAAKIKEVASVLNGSNIIYNFEILPLVYDQQLSVISVEYRYRVWDTPPP